MITNYEVYQEYYKRLESYYSYMRGYPNAHSPITFKPQMMPSNVNHEMKLSARNQFKGKVIKVKEGDILGQVLVDIGCGNLMSSVITTDSIRELGIKVGSDVKVVAKSTGVMIMVCLKR